MTTGFLVQNANLGSARHVRHVIDIGRFSVLYHKQGGNTHAKVIRVSDCDRRNHRHSLSPSLFSLIRRFRIVKGRIHRNSCCPHCRAQTHRRTLPMFRNSLLSQNRISTRDKNRFGRMQTVMILSVQGRNSTASFLAPAFPTLTTVSVSSIPLVARGEKGRRAKLPRCWKRLCWRFPESHSLSSKGFRFYWPQRFTALFWTGIFLHLACYGSARIGFINALLDIPEKKRRKAIDGKRLTDLLLFQTPAV